MFYATKGTDCGFILHSFVLLCDRFLWRTESYQQFCQIIERVPIQDTTAKLSTRMTSDRTCGYIPSSTITLSFVPKRCLVNYTFLCYSPNLKD
ncbi:hypothetical protein NPIL_601941 [Nephila pilipes]|uniref:Uncharacterized protein n=1 Tax=Nephila pilipes TaxID=299642 RepID=A0A8X6NQ31_NEPPI|nr:hypothetical protein NPIL_601941 [Nephila pilipes]